MRSAVLTVGFFVLFMMPFALAATNCEPPVGSDWIFNSSNSTLLCDNGTTVDLGGYALILNENATATFTNGTNLTAGNITVGSASASLLFANTTSTNATLHLSAGNATFQDGASFSSPPILTGGILKIQNGSLGVTTLAGTATTLQLLNVTGASSTVNLSGASTLTLTNATLSSLLLGGSTAATIAQLTATSASISGSAAATVTTATLDSLSSTSSGSLTLASLTAANLTLGGTGTATLSALTLTTLLTLKGNQTAAFSGSGNTVAQFAFGDASQAAGYLATMRGNVTVTNTTASFDNQSVTRVYPLFLVDEAASPVASRTIRVVTNASDAASSVWNGTTDSDGYAAPNVTFTSATYDDTYYLYVDGYTEGQTTALTLLNDTPLNWTLDTRGPTITLAATSATIYGGSFHFNATLASETRYANYTIANGTTTWSNGSYNASQLATSGYDLNESFGGIFLPPGNWTITVTAIDAYNNTNSSATNISSAAAILATLTSSASQSATIGGSAISFSFNVTAKGGSIVEAYLNLTNGALTYDSTYARLANSTANVSVGTGGAYTGAGNVTLPALTGANTPGYVTMNLTASGAVTQETLTLSITPYSGLSAGTYSGSYGFGLFG